MARSLLILPLILAAACASCSKDDQPILLDDDTPLLDEGAQIDRPREAGEDLIGPTGEMSCPAKDYQGFVGKNLAAVIYPADLKVRIIEPGMMVTMEYIADRMNIHVDEDGTITKIVCG
ncbi:I78 family peptidase inhibitor [Parvularcula lutaonensis]|uniref:I78 family peptidase inhibitor n=1 Tax=Parvularcula lutaonensis TaxID=491923 RepID=A0ABV7M7D3_9PROT|nr:I78 family peptidase inhibitor [Parvularcula lutaonensis]GGY41950.1 hypothetical protein GCM10007148_08220 [Parvularcula lutaonensis]